MVPRALARFLTGHSGQASATLSSRLPCRLSDQLHRAEAIDPLGRARRLREKLPWAPRGMRPPKLLPPLLRAVPSSLALDALPDTTRTLPHADIDFVTLLAAIRGRSTGRSDQTAVVLRYARAAELALASRARGSRDPGRRRRSRPTLTTPRESVPRRTGRGRHRTAFQGCQGLFSRGPSSRKPRSGYPGSSDAGAHEDPGSRCARPG